MTEGFDMNALLAQAQQKGLKLLTVDPQMLRHELPEVLAA